MRPKTLKSIMRQAEFHEQVLVLFERSTTGYGAHAPDLAMKMHLTAMRTDGDQIPEPSHFELEVAV